MWTSFELFLPWQFSPATLTAVLLAAALYGRGGRGTQAPVVACPLAFYLGLLLIYLALQTKWDYFASHMFFVLQGQHFALHDLGPALLAGATPRLRLARAVPPSMHVASRAMKRALRAPIGFILNPCTAVALYLAGLLIWLWPPLTFYVMVSNALYALMSWSVCLLALPFWSLVLDPRPYPLARVRPGGRLVMLYLAMLPIVLVSVSLTLAQRDWYPVYAVCGRFLPIPAVADQQLAGVVMWVLGTALFAVVFLIVLGRNLEQEETAAATAAASRT